MVKAFTSNSIKVEQAYRYYGRDYFHSTYMFTNFYFLLLTIFLLSSLHSFAQDSIVVKGRFINNTKYSKVLMKKFGVGNFPVVGAAINQERFTLSLPASIEPGIYRFQYAMAEDERYIDIIINGKEKEIAFSLEAINENAAPLFTASEENQRWYTYTTQTNAQLLKIDLLNQFIYTYPNSNASVIKAALQEWDQEKAVYWENFNSFKTDMQDSWANEMVVNRPYYFANPKDHPRIQDYEKREHFWDGFNANNPKLLNTPLYTEHILNFLRYWMNPNMDFSAEEKTNGFKSSVDIIIRKFGGNEQTLDFAYKYLTLGFKEIGEEEVLQYLDENYKDLANRCFDDFEKTKFDKRMEGYAAMKVGNLAPDFALKVESEDLNLSKDANYKVKTLYKIKAKKTILVFWSSTCPHCLEEMPKLNEWAATQKGVQVIAISIDTDRTLYQETIKQFSNLMHTCDYVGWNTEAATKYFIAATPTFIVLDTDKKILGKYSSIEQIKNLK
jgi:thiol-disulfide isomerase/thioredoxin